VDWLSAVPTIVCLAVAALHLARLAPASVLAGDPPADRADELAHLLVALGMAAMFSRIGSPVPPLQWVVFFGLTGSWFLAQALRAGVIGGDAAHHVVHSVAMLLMVQWWGRAAVGGGPHGAGGSTGLVPVVAVLFAGYFIWYGVRCLDLLRVARAGTHDLAAGNTGGGLAVAARVRASGRTVRSPGTAQVAHIVMAVAMCCMMLAAV
jgi:hypothetical protein